MPFLYNPQKNISKDEQYSPMIMPKHTKKAYLSASATVEACIVIPIFIYAVMAVVYVLQIIGLQMKVSQNLYNSSRQIAKYAYLQSTEHQIGNDGNLDIVISSPVKNPFDIFGIGISVMNQRVYVRAWTGDEDSNDTEEITDTGEHMVYITATGTVYHTNKNCTYLMPSIHQISVSEISASRNNNGGKYYACERCGGKTSDKLYITDYGDRYHTSINCSNLKRNIITIPLSRVSGMRECSKCAG